MAELRSSRDSTPEISPLRLGLNEDADEAEDQEEGEITNDNLSVISEDELLGAGENLEEGELPCLSSPVSEKSQYDVRRYYRDGSSDGRQRDTISSGFLVDSPASPDDPTAVAGSPLKIIPASPTRPQESGSEDDEDIDEDILYLRLIALRSMAAEEEKEKEKKNENQARESMAQEMQQLLEEANEAAGLEETDSTISSMKMNLEKSFRSFSCREDNYTPTQSPTKLTPGSSPQHLSTAPETLDIIDLVSPVPSPEQIPLPGLPPLPPPPLLPSPNSVPRPPVEPEPEPISNPLLYPVPFTGYFTENSVYSFDQPPPPPPPPPPSQPTNVFVPTRLFSPLPAPIPAMSMDFEEPLPPGEDSLPLVARNHDIPSASFQHQNCDFNWRDQEAESRFFRSQETSSFPISFPSSVWSFGLKEPESTNCFQTSYEYAPPVNVDKAKPLHEEKSANKRKRKDNKRKSSGTKRRKSSGEKKEDDDEEKLRALLLTQVNKNKNVKKSSQTIKAKESVVKKKPIELKEVVGKMETIKSRLESKEAPMSNLSLLAPKAPPTSLKNVAPKLTTNASLNKNNPVLISGGLAPRASMQTKAEEKIVYSRLKPAANVRKKKTVKKSAVMSKADKVKHFPNLSKKIVIPLNEDSDSDEEKTKNPIPNPSVASFQLNLDSFLKEVRQKTVVQKGQNVNMSNIAKKNVSIQLKAKAQLLSTADKKKLVSSNISNLPLIKQLEYKKLKELIAKKEMLKAKSLGGRSVINKPGASNLPPKKLSATSTQAGIKKPLVSSLNLKATAPKTSSKGHPSASLKTSSLQKLPVLNKQKTSTPSKATNISLVPDASVKGLAETPNAVNDDKTEPHDIAEKKKLKTTEETEDDEEALRQSLLRDLEKKSSLKTAETTVVGKINTKESLTVQISGNRRNVSVPGSPGKNKASVVKKSFGKSDVRNKNGRLTPSLEEIEKLSEKTTELKPVEGISTDEIKHLKETEQTVIFVRKNLSSVLYKLSAQMSQLQKQSIELEGAVNYAAELRNQLRETEQLVKLREEKVENLREVIRNSHQEVTVFKEKMLRDEKHCEELGGEVYGSDYTLPPQGAQNIRKKLEQIKNTAQKVKTSKGDAPSAVKVGDESGSLKTKTINAASGLVSGLDYVSPLEHVRSENDPAQVFDPDTLLCRFELGGKCMDSSCRFQHCGPK